jgi:hypothetical protein
MLYGVWVRSDGVYVRMHVFVCRAGLFSFKIFPGEGSFLKVNEDALLNWHGIYDNNVSC